MHRNFGLTRKIIIYSDGFLTFQRFFLLNPFYAFQSLLRQTLPYGACYTTLTTQLR